MLREWELTKDLLPVLTLATDSRLKAPNYFDDQIWELRLQAGEPSGISLQTTYGLRALSMRIFPRFVEGSEAKNNPETFHEPPAIRRFYPNYALVTFAPFHGIDVIAEYRVDSSNTITGRLRVINSGVTQRTLTLSLIAMLVPGENGQRMALEKFELANLLQGHCESLFPTLFMTGSTTASHSPYPSLSIDLDLLPGLDRVFTWVHAAEPEREAAFKKAKEMASVNWTAALTRIEMRNAGQLEIHSQNTDWDLVMALGQQTAYLLLQDNDLLPNPSFVLTRRPGQGFSRRGDGSDYDYLWNGQTPLETWYLSQLLLPGEARIVQGLLENFLAAQKENGFIDLKNSPTQKNSSILATPLLCDLAWRIYQNIEDQTFLETTFPKLLRFLYQWFSPEHDRDGDGIPEWDHILQTGYEDNPLFSQLYLGVDITQLESPALCALLLQACKRLLQMARVLKEEDTIRALETRMDQLLKGLEMMWDNRSKGYYYIDRESHVNPAGKSLGYRKGSGRLKLSRFSFKLKTRLLVHITTSDPGYRSDLQVFIAGSGDQGEEMDDVLPATAFRWNLGVGTCVSENMYLAFEYIEIEGLEPKDTVRVYSLDYQFHDQTLLLPLWAGALSAEGAQNFTQQFITNPKRYWGEYGILGCASNPTLVPEDLSDQVWMPWNAMIGEGLALYEDQKSAGELVGKLLNTIAKNIKSTGNFYKQYHGHTGIGSGERNILYGLPPLQLFLQALGVQILSPWEVRLNGRNPFSETVQLRFRGLFIEREQGQTTLKFPNGKTIVVEDAQPCTVKIERGDGS